MRRDSLVFALAGTFFGVLVGWIVGTQQAQAPAPAPPPAAQQAASPAAAAPSPAADAAPGASEPAPVFDAAKAAELEREANADPANSVLRTQLGNLYFDAEKFDQAIPWYEAALKLDTKNASLSTDLAVAYYYTNQTDRALAQLDHSLALDPAHLKTLLNQGIVLAFGKQDLAGAAKSWERVVALAPNSEEGRRAQQGLDGIRSHQAPQPSGATGPGK